MRKILLLGALWALACPVLGAEGDAFAQGNAAYQNGDFAAARDQYESLIQKGNGGAALYFNLGNAYYRLGQMGPARLWYERAVALAPRDEDIRHNRDLLRERVGETEAPSDGLQALQGWLWILATVANLAFFLLLALGLYRESEWIWWGRWGMGIAFALLFSAALAAHRQASVQQGVIKVARAEARMGPSSQEPVGFVAPEGHRVVLLDTLNEWVQVGVPAKGLKGWVPKDAVESIRLPTK